MNIKLTISYDGTAYHGFQKQNDYNTVERELTRAIEATVKHPVKLFIAGRTDRGVHAMGQVVNFFSDMTIDIGNFPNVVNYHLPEDIAVVKSEFVNEDFHARFSAVGKEYKYIIYNGKYRNPLVNNRAFHFPYNLDILKMKEASKYLIGLKDFNSFMGRHAVVKDTIRRLDSIEIKKEGNFFIFDFSGKSFLKNMIRIVVGTLVEVGRGRFSPEYVEEILNSKDRKLAGPTAPAGGLYLMKIKY